MREVRWISNRLGTHNLDGPHSEKENAFVVLAEGASTLFSHVIEFTVFCTSSLFFRTFRPTLSPRRLGGYSRSHWTV